MEHCRLHILFVRGLNTDRIYVTLLGWNNIDIANHGHWGLEHQFMGEDRMIAKINCVKAA
jgi:hypothetical protein